LQSEWPAVGAERFCHNSLISAPLSAPSSNIFVLDIGERPSKALTDLRLAVLATSQLYGFGAGSQQKSSKDIVFESPPTDLRGGLTPRFRMDGTTLNADFL